jgi:hypothetical protein
VLSVVVSVLIGACTSATSLSSPTPTVTNEVTASHTDAPTTSARPTAQMLVRGDLLTLPAEPDMVTFFAHGRSLIAWTSGNRPSPFLDKIQRADPPGGPWRTIFSNDAHFRIQRVSEGHMAIVAYREDGEGAYNESIVVLDLATGAATTIDHYALSKATFRGGGGAPRRPVGQIALGQQMIAWTHLFERAGGAVEGELRVAPLADPRATTVIARSTGGDRHLTAFAAQTQVSGRGAPARSGPWVGWLETKPALAPTRAVPSIVTFEAFNIATGEERSMNIGGLGCSPLTANAFAFAWSCRSSADPPATLQAFDVAQWKLVDVLRPGSVNPFGLQAVDSGFVWTDADRAQRQVHLFTPAPGAFGQP